jgi:DNA-binding PadR family transcriptional regulator
MTNSELILLSLISEQPRHGYELEQVIEERGMRNWTELAFSSIYFVLNKLVKDGFAKTTIAPAAGRGPAKKVFSATPVGEAALRDGVIRSIREPQIGSQAFLFGLSCLPLLGQTEAVESLKSRRRSMLSQRDELAQHPALTQPGFPAHVTAMFTYSLALIQSEINWLETYIQQIEKGGIHARQDRPA